MKNIFAFGTLIVSGALVAAACTASDSDNNPDNTKNTGGTSAGGSSADGGTSAGGSSADGGTTSTSTSTTTTASGGTYSSGGTSSYAGEAGMGAGGWAGDPDTSSGGSTTSTTGGGTGGTGFDCLGDDEVDNLPDCGDLPYADETCDEFEPPEPFGMTYCKQFAEHATPEAFVAMFNCLSDIDAADACGDEHDDAVLACRDGNGDDIDGVAPLTCPSDVARAKCANLGCPEIDTEEDGTCDVYLSMLTASGIDHVIACTNEFTNDEPGGTWGAGPDTTGCGGEFLACLSGVQQPSD